MFYDTSASTALGVSAIPWIVVICKSMFSGSSKELGFPPHGDWFGLVVASVVAYAAFHDGIGDIVSADKIVKYVGGIWNVLNGVFLPGHRRRLPRHGEARDRFHKLSYCFTSTSGTLSRAAMGVYMTSLANGISSEMALGYGWIVWLCAAIDWNFVSKVIGVDGFSKDPQYVWMLIGTLALSSGEGGGMPAAGESP